MEKPLVVEQEGLKKPILVEHEKPLLVEQEPTLLMDSAKEEKGAHAPSSPLHHAEAQPQPGTRSAASSSSPPSPRVDRSQPISEWQPATPISNRRVQNAACPSRSSL